MVDVTDDYYTEKQQVRDRFTYSDYMIKAVVGAASPTLDQMDEHRGGGDGGCCTIM